MNRSDDGRPRAYLAGAMEHAPDRGRGWRARLAPVLAELGHGYYDPCEEELAVVTLEERERFREWKAAGHERFGPLMRRIIAHDLAALESSDYLVCYWDEHARVSGGTPAEVTLAQVWGKPVYLVRAIARAEISAWVLGCATLTFDSLDDLSRYLKEEYGTL